MTPVNVYQRSEELDAPVAKILKRIALFCDVALLDHQTASCHSPEDAIL